jgi:hypothetical protein
MEYGMVLHDPAFIRSQQKSLFTAFRPLIFWYVVFDSAASGPVEPERIGSNRNVVISKLSAGKHFRADGKHIALAIKPFRYILMKFIQFVHVNVHVFRAADGKPVVDTIKGVKIRNMNIR